MKATNLKVEYMTNPIGIDYVCPRFSWIFEQGTKQTAYQIIAKDDFGNLLWDSGKVLNEGRLEVSYNCDVTKNCSCCEKTGSLYKSENRAVCSLTFKLRDRFANPTDKVDLHADNYDQRQKCFKACLCRYDQWTDYLAISLGQGGQGEYFQCIQDCEKRYPDTDLLWATPYNITATWTDSKVFNLPVERCE